MPTNPNTDHELRNLSEEQVALMDTAAKAGVDFFAEPVPEGEVPAGKVRIFNSNRAFNITLSRFDVPDSEKSTYDVPVFHDTTHPWIKRFHIPAGDSMIPNWIATHFGIKMHGVQVLK